MLTESQIAQFRADGYTTAPTLFDRREVAALRAELERFKREGLGRNVVTAGDGVTHTDAEVNYQIIPLNTKSTLMRALPFAPKVVACISQLIGPAFVRQLDQIFLKPGRTGAGTDWHQDNAYFQAPDPAQGTALWIALHDATLENGTLHVIPGSHRQRFAHERDLTSDHHIHMQVDESQAVPIPLPAGGAAFFNYGIAHATKRNNTDHERAGLAFHFLSTEALAAARLVAGAVHVAGPQATGGEAEYGVKVAGSWEAEVARLAPV
jgi:phytanoyl-CoA hydroxylase